MARMKPASALDTEYIHRWSHRYRCCLHKRRTGDSADATTRQKGWDRRMDISGRIDRTHHPDGSVPPALSCCRGSAPLHDARGTTSDRSCRVRTRWTPKPSLPVQQRGDERRRDSHGQARSRRQSLRAGSPSSRLRSRAIQGIDRLERRRLGDSRLGQAQSCRAAVRRRAPGALYDWDYVFANSNNCITVRNDLLQSMRKAYAGNLRVSENHEAAQSMLSADSGGHHPE